MVNEERFEGLENLHGNMGSKPSAECSANDTQVLTGYRGVFTAKEAPVALVV